MDKEAVEKLIFETGTIKSYGSRVFSIGPYGTRVGFAFQQSRALNLTGSLFKDSRLVDKPNAKVAIIGAGLSGLMAYAALFGLGHTAVTLFEKEHDVLTTQSKAGHRLVHPCYNRWPMEDRFSSATNFPFLNWHTSSARDVVKMISDQWKTILAGRCSPVKFHHTLKGISYKKNKDQVSITLKDETPLKPEKVYTQDFDFVIFASGFGVERHLSYSDTQSYWDPFDQMSEDRFKQDKREFLVSGAGDGGAIDCLRLAFQPDKLNDVLMNTIAELRSDTYKDRLTINGSNKFELSGWERRIREIEEKYAKKAKDTKSRAKYGAVWQNQIASKLSEFYRGLALELPPDVTSFIDENLDDISRIKYVSNLISPFQHSTAPINKILLGYLLEVKNLDYKQAYVNTKAVPPILEYKSVDLDDRLLDSFCFKALRHGSDAPVAKLAPKFKAASLRQFTSLSDWTTDLHASYIFTQHFQQVLSAEVKNPKYIHRRKELLRAYSNDVFNGVLSHKIVHEEGDRLVCEFYPSNDNDIDEDLIKRMTEQSLRKTGGLDTELYGVAVRHAVPSVIRKF